MNPYFILVGAQLCFTITDLMGRHFIGAYGFKLSNFISLWFLTYVVLKAGAITAQLYIFSQFQLGKTMALFGATSIILSNVLGFLILNEVLSVKEYLGIILAVTAFLIIGLAKA